MWPDGQANPCTQKGFCSKDACGQRFFEDSIKITFSFTRFIVVPFSGSSRTVCFSEGQLRRQCTPVYRCLSANTIRLARHLSEETFTHYLGPPWGTIQIKFVCHSRSSAFIPMSRYKFTISLCHKPWSKIWSTLDRASHHQMQGSQLRKRHHVCVLREL